MATSCLGGGCRREAEGNAQSTGRGQPVGLVILGLHGEVKRRAQGKKRRGAEPRAGQTGVAQEEEWLGGAGEVPKDPIGMVSCLKGSQG
jgi:hypothetical protein